MKLTAAIYVFALVGLSHSASAALNAVLLYDADNGTGTGVPATLPGGTTIVDLSGAGNNGRVGGGSPLVPAVASAIATVEDDPFDVAGELSFDFTGIIRINTIGTDLLTSDLIADNGGYTMSTWIKTSTSGALQQFLAFAGTDGFVINEGGFLDIISHRGGQTPIPGSPILNDGEWHQLTLEFDTSGDPDGNDTSTDNIAGLDGEVVVTIDGTAFDIGTVSTGTFGDTLNRSIGIGGHAQGFVPFDGQLYNPTVFLGVVVPEPSSVILSALALIGLIGRRQR